MNNRGVVMEMHNRFCLLVILLLTVTCALSGPSLLAAPRPEWGDLGDSRGDQMIEAYFQEETAMLADACLADVRSLDQWKAQREQYHKQLLEMLGLDPLPERTDLKATITGTTEHDEFVVEKLHFQSRPRLYVTGNLYRPKDVKRPLPAILYVCGHGGVKKDGVSYGNKVHYHHHGSWFARHGYVCLTIDSLQLGEIEGIHHGTYRYKMWWWNNRGYTPAGVEAWNCIRAIDYLQSRGEVDPERIGVTGRSGGGVYSWWIASIDERIKAAVPVAGITDLKNHVIDGCVEGHCDCMFMVNTYRWDYPLVAAMVAPRPLMIANTDQDSIFPLDGVVHTNDQVRKIYELDGAGDKLGLTVTPGPHKDTQELRVPAFRWFNRHLKGQEPPIVKPADKFFQPQDLKVFGELPEDQLNSRIHETFVPAAPDAPVPESPEAWQKLRDGWREALLQKSFAGWPDEPGPLDVEEAFTVEREGLRFSACDFTSQGPVRLRLYLTQPVDLKKPKLAVLGVLDEEDWRSFVAMMRCGFDQEITKEPSEAAGDLPEPDEPLFRHLRQMQQEGECLMAFIAPRGIGPTAWNRSEKKQTQIRRRFMLLGQTLDGMRVWDVRRAIQAVRSLDAAEAAPLVLQGERQAAGIALYASLFEPDLQRLDLRDLPRTHRKGPILLNVRRYLDIPQTVAMALERSEIVIYQPDPEGWDYPKNVAHVLDWGDERLSVLEPPEGE
jgi:dienelactone hydrolase